MGPLFCALYLRTLEDPPNKVGQQREQQQHEYASDPDQEVQRHFWRVNLFLIHTLTLTQTLSRGLPTRIHCLRHDQERPLVLFILPCCRFVCTPTGFAGVRQRAKPAAAAVV